MIKLSNDKELSNLKSDDITKDKLLDLFGVIGNKKYPKYHTNDVLIIEANKLYNKNKIETTVGRYIYNLFVLEKLLPHIGYQNLPLNKSNIGKIDNRLSELLLEGKITSETFIDYLNRVEWISFACSYFLSVGFTTKLVKPFPIVEKRKKELLKEHSEDLDKPETIALIENELVELAKKEAEKTTDYDIYKSGASKAFGNTYKNMSIIRGAIKDNNTDDFNVSLTNLYNGIDKEEFPHYADVCVTASGSRALGTREGGYISKKMSAAYQSIILDEPDTDCGTTLYNEVMLTNKNYESYKYRYIISGEELVLLNSETKDKFIGKKVKMRSPLYCKSKKICNKCAGELFRYMGIKNAGLVSNRIGTTLLNKALKQFHDSRIKFVNIDIEDFITEYK